MPQSLLAINLEPLNLRTAPQEASLDPKQLHPTVNRGFWAKIFTSLLKVVLYLFVYLFLFSPSILPRPRHREKGKRFHHVLRPYLLSRNFYGV